MVTTYTDFLDILDYELQQEKQGGDTASADKFRFLPHSQSLRIINETYRELAMVSQDQFEMEFTHTFTFDTKTFLVPDAIIRVLAIWEEDSWRILGDSSDLNSSITSVSSEKITNTDLWSSGDTIRLKVVIFPPRIFSDEITDTIDSYTNSSITHTTAHDELEVGDIIRVVFESTRYEDCIILGKTVDTLYIEYNTEEVPVSFTNESARNINFPKAYIKLLILDLKRKSYARKGKAMSQFDYSEFMQLKNKWINEVSRIGHVATIAFEGYGLGR